MDILRKLFKWLINSSENPKEVSMTVRGIIVSYIPLLAVFMSELGFIGIDKDINAYAITITAGLGILLTVIGLIRKLYNTYADSKIVTFKAKKK